MILSSIAHPVNLARAAFLTLALVFALTACSSAADSTEPVQSVTPAVTPASAETQVPAAPAMTPATVSATATPLPQSPTIDVVTTSNIVADWVRAVGQDRVNVSALLPPNSDPHIFQPTPKDTALIADADLVMSVGLFLEASWLDKLIENAARDPDSVVALGEAVVPPSDDEDHEGEHDHDEHHEGEEGDHEGEHDHDEHHEGEEGDHEGEHDHDEHHEGEEGDHEGEHDHDEHHEGEEGDHEGEHDHDEHHEGEEGDHEGEHDHDEHHEGEEGDHEGEHDHDEHHEGEEGDHEGEHDHDEHHEGEEGDHEGEHDHDEHHEGEEGDHEGEHAEHGHHDHHGHDHGGVDPHFWFDPLLVKRAVNSIEAQLSAADPAGQTYYQDNAAAYNRELDTLHTWIQERVATLPEERRLLVTSHDSFQYFATRYGFKVALAILPITTEIEPTAQELADLIEAIEHEGAPAVFAETSHSDRLARRIAEETGTKLVGGLYTGSLGEPGGEAGTYLALMRHNVDTIVGALQ